MNGDYILFWGYVAVWLVASAIWVGRAVAVERPDWRSLSRFHITDIWAWIIGTLPSFILLSYVCAPGRIFSEYELVCVAILFASQCLGMFVAKVHTTPRHEKARQVGWDAAWIYWGGALTGLVWPILVGLFEMALMVCLGIVIFAVQTPICIVGLIVSATGVGALLMNQREKKK